MHLDHCPPHAEVIFAKAIDRQTDQLIEIQTKSLITFLYRVTLLPAIVIISPLPFLRRYKH